MRHQSIYFKRLEFIKLFVFFYPDIKMDTAYDIKRKRRVSAITVEEEYSDIENQIFVVDKYTNEILNYEEVLKKNNLEYIRLTFVKGFKKKINDTDVDVRPFFKNPKKSEQGILMIKDSESEDHKILKNFIYNYIYKNKCKLYYSYNDKEINTINLDKSNFSYIDEEVKIEDSDNYKRADVLLQFKEEHNILGYGIIFEIQLSKQTDDKTEKRTLDRALKGYSTIWLGKDDFYKENNTIFLKEESLLVTPHLNILAKFKDEFFQRIDDEKIKLKDLISYSQSNIKDLEQDIKTKVKNIDIDLKNDIYKLINDLENKIYELKDLYEHNDSKIQDLIDKKDLIKKQVKEYEENMNKIYFENEEVKFLVSKIEQINIDKYNDLINNYNAKELEMKKIINFSEKLNQDQRFKDFGIFLDSLKKYDEMYNNYTQQLKNFNSSLHARVKKILEEIK